MIMMMMMMIIITIINYFFILSKMLKNLPEKEITREN